MIKPRHLLNWPTVFTPLDSPTDLDTTLPTAEPETISPFSPREVERETDRLNLRKAPTHDRITARASQEFPRTAILKFSTLKNNFAHRKPFINVIENDFEH